MVNQQSTGGHNMKSYNRSLEKPAIICVKRHFARITMEKRFLGDYIGEKLRFEGPNLVLQQQLFFLQTSQSQLITA